jgi:hypothetical protein
MCAVLGMRSHSSRATRHARESSRSSPSMVSTSRTPGSLKCFRFRREGAGARRQALPLTAIWTLVDIVPPRAEEPLCGTYELLLLCYGASRRCDGAGEEPLRVGRMPAARPGKDGDRGDGSRDDRDSQPRSSSEHLCRLARKLRQGPRRPGDGDEFRAHILPALAHQTTCLSVNHRDVFLQVEPIQPPELQCVGIAQITSAMAEVARLVG